MRVRQAENLFQFSIGGVVFAGYAEQRDKAFNFTNGVPFREHWDF